MQNDPKFYIPPKTTLLQLFNRMRANAQRDGRPAEHRWRPLLNAKNLADAHY